MITGVAHVGQIDRRPCRAAAERRLSRTRMAASCDRLLPRHRGTPWPAHTYLRYTVTPPCPASGRPVIPGLRGATATLVEGSAFCITQTSGDIRPGEPRRLLAQDARGAAVPPRGQWLVTVEAVPVRDGSPVTLRHPRAQPVEHARAASGVLRGNCAPGRAANTPPGHGQRRGGS